MNSKAKKAESISCGNATKTKDRSNQDPITRADSTNPAESRRIRVEGKPSRDQPDQSRPAEPKAQGGIHPSWLGGPSQISQDQQGPLRSPQWSLFHTMPNR